MEGATAEKLEQLDPVTREALGVLAVAVTRLEAVVHAQGELMKAMDLRIRLLVSRPQ
jgi:Flp pilus assembly protein TadD